MIFVDSSAWYAFHVEDDENHAAARDFLRTLQEGRHGRLVTSDYILDETITLLRLRVGASIAAQFARTILGSMTTLLLWIDQPIFDNALRRLEQHADKRWSFTDCTTFSIMEQLHIQDAFAFDHNFAEAGFTRRP